MSTTVIVQTNLIVEYSTGGTTCLFYRGEVPNDNYITTSGRLLLRNAHRANFGPTVDLDVPANPDKDYNWDAIPSEYIAIPNESIHLIMPLTPAVANPTGYVR